MLICGIWRQKSGDCRLMLVIVMTASVCKLQQYLFCLNMLLNILITQNSLCQVGKQWFINIRLFKSRVYIKQKCATYTGYSYCQNPAVSYCLATAVFTSLWHSQHKCSIHYVPGTLARYEVPAVAALYISVFFSLHFTAWHWRLFFTVETSSVSLSSFDWEHQGLDVMYFSLSSS
jgi:hypothetical protein